MKVRISIYGLLLPVLVMIGCGGGSGSDGTSNSGTTAIASQLDYSDPPSSAGFRWVRNAESTPTHLVLDLFAPAGTTMKGVAFSITLDDTKVDWAPTSPATTCSRSTGLLDLGPDSSTQLFREKINNGSLQVGLFQKQGWATINVERPILSVSMEMHKGIAPGPIQLSSTPGFQSILLNPNGISSPLATTFGVLKAR